MADNGIREIPLQERLWVLVYYFVYRKKEGEFGIFNLFQVLDFESNSLGLLTLRIFIISWLKMAPSDTNNVIVLDKNILTGIESNIWIGQKVILF